MLADPSLRYVRARILEADGKTKDAAALLDDPKQWVASYGPCWAVRGRLLEASGGEGASAAFDEAVAHDPLGVESACHAVDPKPGGGAPLCEAARARNDPDLGRD